MYFYRFFEKVFIFTAVFTPILNVNTGAEQRYFSTVQSLICALYTKIFDGWSCNGIVLYTAKFDFCLLCTKIEVYRNIEDGSCQLAHSLEILFQQLTKNLGAVCSMCQIFSLHNLYVLDVLTFFPKYFILYL